MESVLLESVLLESVLLESVLLESVLLESVLLESVLLESVLLESVLLESVLLESVLLESVLLESVLLESVLQRLSPCAALLFAGPSRHRSRHRLLPLRHAVGGDRATGSGRQQREAGVGKHPGAECGEGAGGGERGPESPRRGDGVRRGGDDRGGGLVGRCLRVAVAVAVGARWLHACLGRRGSWRPVRRLVVLAAAARLVWSQQTLDVEAAPFPRSPCASLPPADPAVSRWRHHHRRRRRRLQPLRPVLVSRPCRPVGRGHGGGRRRTRAVLVVRHRQAHRFAHTSLRAPPPEVALAEVVEIRRVDGPKVSLAVGAAAALDEAVVEREVVADAVPPAGPARPEVRVVVEDPLVDVAEHQLAIVDAEDRHRDQPDVTVARLRLLVRHHEARVRLAVQVGHLVVWSGRRAPGDRVQAVRREGGQAVLQAVLQAVAQPGVVVKQLRSLQLQRRLRHGGAGREVHVGRRHRLLQAVRHQSPGGRR